MTTTYKRISRDEFESVLFGQYPEACIVRKADVKGKELVYDIPTEHDDLVVRVFSSIERGATAARDAGRDAIRVVVWSEEADAPVMGAKRTHRIETWAKNFTAKVDALIENINDFETNCPDCGAIMAHRDGKFGAFLGCTRYPDCRATRPVEGNEDGDRAHADASEAREQETARTAAELPECPDCGAAMARRDGKFGEFLGCTTFPKCRGTRKASEAPEATA